MSRNEPDARRHRAGADAPETDTAADGGHAATGTGRYAATAGLDRNVAGALCYTLGWLTGLAVFLTEDDDVFVRFHAAQSIVVFGGFTLFWVVAAGLLGPMFEAASAATAAQVLGTVVTASSLVAAGLWLALVGLAYDGQWFRLPGAGAVAAALIARRKTDVPRRSPERE